MANRLRRFRPRTYDDWKTTNPADFELGPEPEIDPDEERERRRDDESFEAKG